MTDDSENLSSLISEEANKAKNKLMAISSITIFYIIFEPSLTGSFSPLSMTIHENCEYIPLLVILLICWFLTRFVFLLLNSNDAISLAVSTPYKVLKAIFQQNYESRSTDLKAEKAKLEEKIRAFQQTHGTPPPAPKFTNPSLIDDLYRAEQAYGESYSEYDRQIGRLTSYVIPDLKNATKIDSVKSKTIIGLIIMDLVIPFTLGVVAIIMTWIASDILIINFSQ